MVRRPPPGHRPPRVAEITPFIALGVGFADLAVEFGAVRYIVGLTDPANLPREVGTAMRRYSATRSRRGRPSRRCSSAFEDRPAIFEPTGTRGF